MSPQADAREHRILVLPPLERDGRVTARILAAEGLECHVCRDLAELTREARDGAAALLLSEEALQGADALELRALLQAQPEWSDLPVLLLARVSEPSEIARWAARTLRNVTLLDRPTRVPALVSAVRAAVAARRRQYQLREQIAALREADRRKDLFLATLAHELRNPLTPIVNSLAVLRLVGAGALERTRPLMERQVTQLTRLLDDLLDVSRITSGKLTLRIERVELGAVIRSAIETASPLVHEHGHGLAADLPPQGVFMDGDPVRLAQVFANLINNAAKYMPRGGRIAIAVEPGAEQVTVRVRDWGIGIQPSALTAIFEPFMQADPASDRARSGLGLGLTLVKQLVELHGGRVEARSEGAGRGSEFVVQLPTANAAAEAAQSVRASPA